MPNPYKRNRRLKKQGKKGKGSGGACKVNSNNGAGAAAAKNPVARLAQSLSALPTAHTNGRASRIPPEEREHCWDNEQIERFLRDGEWDESDDDEDGNNSENNAQKNSTLGSDSDLRNVDLNLQVPVREMPAPKPVNSVFGGGNDQQGALLGSLLDPNAGGANKNSDGLMGLLASQQPNLKPPEDPRERLRARLRYMERQRAGQKEEDIVRDKKGRKMRNVRNVTAEDMLYGGAKARNAAIDKSASKKAQQERVAALRAALQAKMVGTATDDAEEIV